MSWRGQPPPTASHLVFHLPLIPHEGKRVVRMPLPLPLASISHSSQQQTSPAVPNMVSNPAVRQKQAESQKDAPQDRILISEVGVLN